MRRSGWKNIITETGSRAGYHLQRLSSSNLLLLAGSYLLKHLEHPQTVPLAREKVFKRCL